ncbi:hypothetical protein M514_26916 [Trichuris suis]|uniref:Uncharacterized protein n=1 Tax=Trichuris suis TaxID=68888 RepID=A0A085MUN1_9BILA|nr:hypothetical protein M514_26916 [Trichuris suis]
MLPQCMRSSIHIVFRKPPQGIGPVVPFLCRCEVWNGAPSHAVGPCTALHAVLLPTSGWACSIASRGSSVGGRPRDILDESPFSRLTAFLYLVKDFMCSWNLCADVLHASPIWERRCGRKESDRKDKVLLETDLKWAIVLLRSLMVALNREKPIDINKLFFRRLCVWFHLSWKHYGSRAASRQFRRKLGTGLFKQLSCFEDLCAVSTSDVSEDGVSCNGLRYFHN